MYLIIYKDSHQQCLNAQLVKKLYDSIDDGIGFNGILKADLSYLMSVSKNKEHIPLLDKAISSLKIRN